MPCCFSQHTDVVPCVRKIIKPTEHFSSYLTIHSHCCPLENANTKTLGWETVFTAQQFMKQIPHLRNQGPKNTTTSSFLKQLLEDEAAVCSKWSNLSLKVLFLERSLMVTLHHRNSNMKSSFLEVRMALVLESKIPSQCFVFSKA